MMRSFQRRSSCSAIPSTTTMDLNDVAGTTRPTAPLGAFLRFENSFSESMTSLSDTSDCAMSGEGSALDGRSYEEGDINMEVFSKMTGVEFPPEESGIRDSRALAKKKKKKKKSQHDSVAVMPSRRRIQRRSSWGESCSAYVPGACDNQAPPLTVYKTRVDKFPHFDDDDDDDDDDGVITSFKVVNADNIMVEEQSTPSSRRRVVASLEPSLVSDLMEPLRRRETTSRRASSTGGVSMDNLKVESDDALRSKGSVIAEIFESHHMNTDPPTNVNTLPGPDVKDVKRSVLMVKHMCSGNAKSSWHISDMSLMVQDSVDLAQTKGVDHSCHSPQPHEAMMQEMKTELDTFNDVSKQSIGEDGQKRTMTELSSSLEDTQQDQVLPTGTMPSIRGAKDDFSSTHRLPRRAERRASWHASTNYQTEKNSNSFSPQRSQMFVLDLSLPINSWQCQEFVNPHSDISSGDRQIDGGIATRTLEHMSSRSWKLRKYRNPRESEDYSPSRFVFVSSASMPCHDWQVESNCDDESVTCLQLTGFGDVTSKVYANSITESRSSIESFME